MKMTYEEVKEAWLKNKPLRHGKHFWLMIADAIEKQIASKPIGLERAGGTIMAYLCPRCTTTTSYYPVWSQSRYCPRCGQLLDWSVLNEKEK